MKHRGISLEMVSENVINKFRQNGMFFRQGGKLVVTIDDRSETLNLANIFNIYNIRLNN